MEAKGSEYLIISLLTCPSEAVRGRYPGYYSKYAGC